MFYIINCAPPAEKNDLARAEVLTFRKLGGDDKKGVNAIMANAIAQVLAGEKVTGLNRT